MAFPMVDPEGAVDDVQQPVAFAELGNLAEVAAVDGAAEGEGVVDRDGAGEGGVAEKEEASGGVADHEDHPAEVVVGLERNALCISGNDNPEGVDALITDGAAAGVGSLVGAEQDAIDLGGVECVAEPILERREGLRGNGAGEEAGKGKEECQQGGL